MRAWLIPVVLILAAGCAKESSEMNAPSSLPTVDANKPSETVSSNNSNRVFQLKDLEVVKVEIKGKTFDLWVMDTEDKRREGMMFLEDREVKDEQGMVFAFKSLQKGNGQYGFWMHNTLIPLDIIYLSPGGKVVQIFEAKAMSDAQLIPKGDYQTVIELKSGMAKKIGLVAGDSVKVSVPAKD